MEKKHRILEVRERLDKTLAMPDLVNEESVRSLVKDQLLRSSFCGNEGDIENVVEKHTREVSNFLEMLRSASGKDHKTDGVPEATYKEWKLKQDTDELRVMYREGPEGTPFHTLLAEGYADGPIDVCLCVSWESTLYKKWWPQYNIPTFKITMSTCLQKIRIGEQISLIRVKITWPVSDREMILHYNAIEYFKEDLIIVLLNTIPETEDIDVSTHGFSGDGIPKVKDIVRMDLVGGFVLQKIDANRSYFRAIANMDIKLDFVPPTLINFISRQLIGSGHKLYQKAIRSVATSDGDYRLALQNPIYAQIRERLNPHNKLKTDLVVSDEKKPTVLHTQEHNEDKPPTMETTPITEIVEVENERDSTNAIITEDNIVVKEKAFVVSPEVEHALRTLDQAIAIVRTCGFSDHDQNDSSLADDELPNLDVVAKADPVSDGGAPENCNDVEGMSSVQVGSSPAEDYRKNSLHSAPREAFCDQSEAACANKIMARSTVSAMHPPIVESMRKVCDEESLMVNGFHANGGSYAGTAKPEMNKKKKRRLCCVSLSLF